MVNYSEIFNNEAISYLAYRQKIDQLLAEDKTTGPDHSADMLQYSKMNVQRMNRLDKTVVLQDALKESINALEVPYKLLLITEGWCGDASQIVPVINKIAAFADDKLSLKLVLRDENLPLIDAHLTNGGRAIPIFLVLNANGDKVLASWGPRPAVAQKLLLGWKSEGLEQAEISEKLHGWYAKDKTLSTQEELITVFKNLK